MSEWIPTSERLPTSSVKSSLREVLVQLRDDRREVEEARDVNAECHIAWKELDDPYVPPKPKRRRGTVDGEWNVNWIEVLPGDPDPDVVLEVLEAWKDLTSQDYVMHNLFKRIEESRRKA